MDPPDFDFSSLSDILGSLSAEDFEKISTLAGQFTGEGKSQKNSYDESDSGSGGFNIDPDMIFRLMGIMQKLNSRQNDPRCNLITALKPLLSPQRRQKADTAIELLRMFSIFSLTDIFGTE